MLRSFFVAFVLSFLVAAGGATSDWQRVTSDACRASFSLPGNVQQDTTMQQLDDEMSLQKYKYFATEGRRLYDVTCAVYPSGSMRGAGNQKAVLEQMAKRIGDVGKVLDKRDVQMDGHDGKEIVLAKDGTTFQYHRLVVAGHRMVIMTAGRLQRTKVADDEALQRFFEALRLLD